MKGRPQPQWETALYAAEFVLFAVFIYVTFIYKPPPPKEIILTVPREYYTSDEAWERAKEGLRREYEKRKG